MSIQSGSPFRLRVKITVTGKGLFERKWSTESLPWLRSILFFLK